MKRVSLVVLFTAASIFAVLAFQNCGMNSGHEVSAATAQSAVLNLASVSDLYWSAGSPGSLKLSSEAAVERWIDATGAGISLYPPFRPNTNSLDLDKSPKLEIVGGHSWLDFKSGDSLQPATGDLREVVSDNFTIMFSVRDFDVQGDAAGNNKVLRFFDMAPTNGDPIGQLGLDVYPEADGSFYLMSYHYFSGTNYRFQRFPLHDSSILKDAMSIAVRFDKSGQQMQVFVNGVKSEETMTVFGNPTALGYAPRLLTLHAVSGTYGNLNPFKMSDFALWRSALSDDVLIAYTKAHHDYLMGGVGTITPTPTPTPGGGQDPTYANVAWIISHNHCLECHSSIATRSGLLAQKGQDGVTPIITVGNGNGSLIIKALKHLPGARPMPDGYGALSSSDIDLISQWITGGALP